MCGIAGILSTNKSLVNQYSLKKMADTLAHRGPDGEGFFINENGNVGFAHRRLSIIDLSKAAAQPMHYMQRYTIVYNGEIYNYRELKSTLKQAGYYFSSESDTEVILAAYDYYKDECVDYFDGMFAFAIWDELEQQLFCARDLFGEKPFYYFVQNDAMAFASEMKALWSVGIDKTMDEGMMANYLALGFVENANDKSQTFFKNIFSLPPAHTGLFSLATNQFEFKRYYDIDKEANIETTEKEAIEKIHWLLETSVNRRLRSDVPIGSSLSGGIDSSTIAYFISQQNNKQSFKTFSAIFPGFEKDESKFIQELSTHLQFENNSISPSSNDFLNDFEKIAYHQEEPLSSMSIFVQYKVYEIAAANNIKVLLDGQGADEIFAGYTKYIHWYIQELISHYKFSESSKQRKLFHKNGVDIKWGFKNLLATYLPSHASLALEKKAYNAVIDNNFISSNLMNCIKGKESNSIYKPTVSKLNDVLYHNCMEFGLEELLRYADRNSMANGVEVRLPFLNRDLVEFVFSLPSSFKINNGFTKNILRKTMQDKIPNKILWNSIKVGFEPPQKSWMEDTSVQDLIHEAKKKLVNENIVNPTILERLIQPAGAHEENNLDWRVLSLAQAL